MAGLTYFFRLLIEEGKAAAEAGRLAAAILAYETALVTLPEAYKPRLRKKIMRLEEKLDAEEDCKAGGTPRRSTKASSTASNGGLESLDLAPADLLHVAVQDLTPFMHSNPGSAMRTYSPKQSSPLVRQQASDNNVPPLSAGGVAHFGQHGGRRHPASPLVPTSVAGRPTVDRDCLEPDGRGDGISGVVGAAGAGAAGVAAGARVLLARAGDEDQEGDVAKAGGRFLADVEEEGEEEVGEEEEDAAGRGGERCGLDKRSVEEVKVKVEEEILLESLGQLSLDAGDGKGKGSLGLRNRSHSREVGFVSAGDEKWELDGEGGLEEYLGLGEALTAEKSGSGAKTEKAKQERIRTLNKDMKENLEKQVVTVMNEASKDDLIQLHGIGVRRAQLIVESRAEAPFQSLGDLTRIGMFEKQIEKMGKHNMLERLDLSPSG